MTCPTCHRSLPASAYYRQSGGGRMTQCKRCHESRRRNATLAELVRGNPHVPDGARRSYFGGLLAAYQRVHGRPMPEREAGVL